jgi:ABC-type lipopolysaccharide export system ATPase subunit
MIIIKTFCHEKISDKQIRKLQGEITALIGPYGGLILSLVHPNAGEIYMTSEQEKLEICASSRKLISYVPQGNTLFSEWMMEILLNLITIQNCISSMWDQ